MLRIFTVIFSGDLSKESRVEATRVDAEDIIEQIFEKTIKEHNQKQEGNESLDGEILKQNQI